MNEELSSQTLDERELDKQEKAQWREKRRVIRAKKVSRLRPLKNFIWWFTGFLTPIVLVVVILAVGIAAIPVSTYFKMAGIEDTSEYVSEEVGKGSLLNGIQNIGEYTMEDVPAFKMLVKSLTDALSDISINGTSIIKVDEDKLDALKDKKIIGEFSDFLNEFTSCLSIVATIGTFTSDLGDMGKLPVVNEFEEAVGDTDLLAYFSSGTPLETPQMYYYDPSQIVVFTGGASGFSTEEGQSDQSEKSYERAFTNDGALVDALSALSQEQRMMVKFYYPALDSVPLVDFTSVFGPRFKMTKVSSILEVFSTGNDDSILNKIAGDETIETLGDLEDSDILLVDVIDPPSDEKPEDGDPDYDAKLEAYNKNRELYNIIKDSTGKSTNEEITLADLSDMDTDEITLANIIDAPTSDDPTDTEHYDVNRTLYDILLDAAGLPYENYTSYRNLKVKHLNDFEVDNIKLSTLMEEGSNKIINALLEQDRENEGDPNYVPVSIGTIGDRINDLLVSDVYDVECFTTDINKARENSVVYYKGEESGKVVYSRVGTGTPYYISKEANVWLFLLFTPRNVDTSNLLLGYTGTGVAESYICSDLTIDKLDSSIGSVSASIMNATIRQAYDSGLISNPYENIFGMTIVEVMAELDYVISTR